MRLFLLNSLALINSSLPFTTVELFQGKNTRKTWLNAEKETTDDPFEDLGFDPRLSPHSYKSSDDTKKESGSTGGFGFIGEQISLLNLAEGIEEKNSMLDDFDPRLSPHMYPDGINKKESTLPESTKSMVGILLIDHGSRREESNNQLKTLAKTYKESSRCPPHFAVQAAHMEIASPSILDSLRSLIFEENCDKVICHPYFLSQGRHVTQDIPQLVSEAEAIIKNEILEKGMGRNIQICVTEALGSQVDIMLSGIDRLVQASAKNDFVSEDAGFFNNIQRQMEMQEKMLEEMKEKEE